MVKAKYCPREIAVMKWFHLANISRPTGSSTVMHSRNVQKSCNIVTHSSTVFNLKYASTSGQVTTLPVRLIFAILSVCSLHFRPQLGLWPRFQVFNLKYLQADKSLLSLSAWSLPYYRPAASVFGLNSACGFDFGLTPQFLALRASSRPAASIHSAAA